MDNQDEDQFKRYKISDLVVDTGSRRVFRDGEQLKLGRLTFDFLVALIEHAPAMTGYDQIADQVWKGRPVSAETIAQRAKMLRAALDDDAHNPRYFELIRGEGYRLLVDVNLASNSAPLNRSARRWGALVAVAVVAASILAAVMLQTNQRTPSIAVMPFADMSAAGDQRYLADGIAEELLNQLARLDGLEVASRSESFYWQQPVNDLQAIGRELNVSAILEGSVRRVDDDVRVTVQLIDVKSGYHIWSNTYDRRIQDLLVTQEDIAVAVASALGIQLGVGDISAFRGAGTNNYEAFEAYLLGDPERAIRIDPNYAAAWTDLALMIASTMHTEQAEDAPAIIEGALEHSARAVALEPNYARGLTIHATLTYPQMRWVEAEEIYRRALELRRGVDTLSHFANMHMRTGRSTSALQLHREADRLRRRSDRDYFWLLANVDIALGRFETVRQEDIAGTDYAQALIRLMVELNSGTPEAVRDAMDEFPSTSLDYRVLFRPLLEVFDSREEALDLLAQLADDTNSVWPYKQHNIALLAAYLGDPELALEVFARDLRYTPVRLGAVWYPLMSEMRRLPAFKQLVRDINLDVYWREYGWADFCRPIGEGDFLCE